MRTACAATSGALEMPTKETLDRFIARVESNAHAAAVEEFYSESCIIRENQTESRTGRDGQVARERALLTKAERLESRCIRPVVHIGDNVAIRWVFEFHWRDGTVTRMEEVALQRWEGERIAEETFFYDPAQKIPRVQPVKAA
jgi:ketosteroid isomerase-like protein